MSETGIYIRVGKEDVLLENLNEIERTLWLEGLSEKGLIKTVNICCDVIEDFIVNYQDVARRVKVLEEEIRRLKKCEEKHKKSTEKCDEIDKVLKIIDKLNGVMDEIDKL